MIHSLMVFEAVFSGYWCLKFEKTEFLNLNSKIQKLNFSNFPSAKGLNKIKNK